MMSSLIERPKMNEKLLVKPPFKFIMDIMFEILKVTGIKHSGGRFRKRTLHSRGDGSRLLRLKREEGGRSPEDHQLYLDLDQGVDRSQTLKNRRWYGTRTHQPTVVGNL